MPRQRNAYVQDDRRGKEAYKGEWWSIALYCAGVHLGDLYTELPIESHGVVVRFRQTYYIAMSWIYEGHLGSLSVERLPRKTALVDLGIGNYFRDHDQVFGLLTKAGGSMPWADLRKKLQENHRTFYELEIMTPRAAAKRGRTVYVINDEVVSIRVTPQSKL